MFSLLRSTASIVVTIIVTAMPFTVQAIQITPNPNPDGSTIEIINDLSAVNLENPFINEGTINIDSNSKLTNSMYSIGAMLINADIVNNYGILLTDDGNITNTGTLNNFAGAGLGSSDGGTLTNAIGGTVNNYGRMGGGAFSGIMTNAGTLNNFAGALLSSGLVGNGLINSGTLNNFAGASVSITDAEVTNTVGATVNNYGSMGFGQGDVINNGTFNNFGSTNCGINECVNSVGATLNNSGQMEEVRILENAGTMINIGALNNDFPYGTIQNSGTLINKGLIQLDSYSQTTGQTINDGTLTGSVTVQGGSIRGSGVINGDVTLEGGTFLSPGDTMTPGTFTINGDLQSSGKLLFRLGGLGLGDFDTLNILGNALFSGGTVEFDFLNFNPVAGDSWDFLFDDSIIGWETLTFDFDGLAPDLTYAFNNSKGIETLSLYSAPEPSTIVLLGSGLMMLLVASRKQLAHTDNKALFLIPVENDRQA
jgi:hypothetical protein